MSKPIYTHVYYVWKYGYVFDYPVNNDGLLLSVNSNLINFYHRDPDGYSYTHRWDGPARIGANGMCVWCFNGKLVCRLDDFGWDGILAEWAFENGVDLDNLTDNDINLIKLVFSTNA